MTQRPAAMAAVALVAGAVALGACGPGPGGNGAEADGPPGMEAAARPAGADPVRAGMPTVAAGDGREIPRVAAGEPLPPDSLPPTTLVGGRPAHVTVLPNTLLFEYDDATLRPEAAQALGEVADVARRFRAREIIVAGHASSEGGEAYNRRLSEARADVVAAYLVQAGLGAATVTAFGYGETMPVAPNETDEGREANRRVLVTVMVP